MTNPDHLVRTTLSVSRKAHAAVIRMQKTLKERLGYRVTQSEAIVRGMEALEREQEEHGGNRTRPSGGSEAGGNGLDSRDDHPPARR